MASLSIKNVPDEMLNPLRERAQNHRRSMQGELLTILEDVVRPASLILEIIVQRVTERGIMTGDESTTMVRAERDAR